MLNFMHVCCSVHVSQAPSSLACLPFVSVKFVARDGAYGYRLSLVWIAASQVGPLPGTPSVANYTVAVAAQRRNRALPCPQDHSYRSSVTEFEDALRWALQAGDFEGQVRTRTAKFAKQPTPSLSSAPS